MPAKTDSFPVTYRPFIMTQKQTPLELHKSPETYFKILQLSARARLTRFLRSWHGKNPYVLHGRASITRRVQFHFDLKLAARFQNF